jgi:hypothetical protein
MIGSRRVSTTFVVVVCLFAIQSNVPLFASEQSAATIETVSQPTRTSIDVNAEAARALQGALSTFLPPQFGTASPQIYRGAPYPYPDPNRNDGSLAAIMIGAAAAITGTALLVYANRPECSINRYAGGCGYGVKVIGTSVLTGGALGMVVGALTWR